MSVTVSHWGFACVSAFHRHENYLSKVTEVKKGKRGYMKMSEGGRW